MEHTASHHRCYTILGVIGEGGFGRVYRARLTEDGFEKDVAIKVLHDRNPEPDLLARFRDEARILGLLRDRAVVSVDPPIQLDDRWAVVMDFVDGLSLGQIVRRLGRLPPAVALEITAEIARALHKAYTFPGPDGQPIHLLHRDIKPANIQITPSGEVRLLDFGTAWADFSNREANTEADIAGTPGYIAPERLEGVEGPAGDIFSLGVMLWFALTGERPGQRRGADLTNALVELAADDGDLAAALSLAIRMRDRYEGGRPTAKQVQDEARELVRRMPQPHLLDWCVNVPHRDMQDDPLTGQTLSATIQRTVDEPTGSTVSRTLVVGTGFGLSAMLIVVALALGTLIGIGLFLVVRNSGPADREIPPEPEPIVTVVPAGPSTPMTFVSEPPGATVVLDGESIGMTPLVNREVSNGEHRIEMSKGLFNVDGVLQVGTDGVTSYNWDIIKGKTGVQPPFAGIGTVPLTFRSVPGGAEVWLDGVQVGETPLADHRVSDGRHELELRKGLMHAETQIDVSTDGPTTWVWEVIQGNAGLTAADE